MHVRLQLESSHYQATYKSPGKYCSEVVRYAQWLQDIICTIRRWDSKPTWVWVTSCHYLLTVSLWIPAFRVSVTLANRREVHYHGPYQSAHPQRARDPNHKNSSVRSVFRSHFQLRHFSGQADTYTWLSQAIAGSQHPHDCSWPRPMRLVIQDQAPAYLALF